MSEGFKNRKYLKKILYQFNYIGKNGAVNEKDSDCVNMLGVHNGFFVVVPDTLRRCYFLSSTEKEVLWELISWANVDEGYCKVLQGIVSNNLNMSVSTVKAAIKSLITKGFIEKRVLTKRENLYKIADMSKNPYILISEAVHHNLIKFIEDIQNDYGFVYAQDNNCNYSFGIEAYKAGVRTFVDTPQQYMPIVIKLKDSKLDFPDVYKEAMADLDQILTKCYYEAGEKIRK